MSPRSAGQRPSRIVDEQPRVERISTATTIFVLIVVGLVLYGIQWILLPFVISGLAAYVCTPVVDWISRYGRLPRGVAAAFVFLAIVGFAMLVAWLGLPPLVRETQRLATDFQPTVKSLAQGVIGNGTVNLFGRPIDAGQIAQAAASGARDWLGHPGRIALIGGLAFSGIFAVFLIFVLLFYFLAAGPMLARALLWLVPPKQRPLIAMIWSRLDPLLRRYFIGILAVVLYATVAAYIGLGIGLGLHHAVVLALLTGILEMIPMVGPAAAIAITGLVAVHSAVGVGPIIGYAIYVTALRLSIDQLFGPLALGSAARVHPTLIIFAFLSGGMLFGVTGVILAVPIALSVKVALATQYDEPPPNGEARQNPGL